MVMQHHIGLGPEHLEGNDGLGRYVLLPGDPSRAEKIAGRLTEVERIASPRRFDAFLGRLEDERGPIDVLALPSGIGAASTEVVVHELLECGARRLVRVGSCGSHTPAIEPGQVVVATGAVRDEATGDDYAPREFPAVAHRLAVEAMVEGARRVQLDRDTFCGIVHSKASLYAREFGHGPAGERNLEYGRWLERCGVVASEMEASILYVMASSRGGEPSTIADERRSGGCQAVAVLAVFGTVESHMRLDEEKKRLAEARAIEIALAGIRVWARGSDSGRGGG